MSRIIRLTESELINLVKRVLVENPQNPNFVYRIPSQNMRSKFAEAYLSPAGKSFHLYFVDKNNTRPEQAEKTDRTPFVLPLISEITAQAGPSTPDRSLSPMKPVGETEESFLQIRKLLTPTEASPSDGGFFPVIFVDSDNIPKIGYIKEGVINSEIAPSYCKGKYLKKPPTPGTILNYRDCWAINKKQTAYLTVQPDTSARVIPI